MSDRIDDFERGLNIRKAILGDERVDQLIAGTNHFSAEFQDFLTRIAWYEVWHRPGLEMSIRRLLVLGMTMGLARWEEFELNCRAAIQASKDPASGVTLLQIQETLIQGALYCGMPSANTAFKRFTELMRQEGIPLDPTSLAPEVRPRTHQTFSSPQLRVSLQGQGSKVPVVLSHALGLDLRMWDELARELAAAGHPVLRYDHRGHGKSAVPDGPYSMDDLVSDAARVVREWGVGPVVWVGLSLGGMVGQGLAIRHPGLLRGLVLANTTARYPDAAQAGWEARIRAVEIGGLQAVIDMVVDRYVHEEWQRAHPEQVARLRETLQRTDPSGYVAACHAVAGVNWIPRLLEIKVPTLVIAGERDAGAPAEMAEAIHQEIENSRLVVLEAASHLSVIEKPQQFLAVVQDFLARVDQPSAETGPQERRA